MKRIISTTVLALTLALSGTVAAYTPTVAQCEQAGGFFDAATQGCGVAGRRIAAVPGVTYQVIKGDVLFYSGTTVYVQQPGTVTFCPCPRWQ